MSRLLSPCVLFLFAGLACGQSPKFAKDGLDWYDLRSLDVEGQGFKDVKAPYDRLPAKAEGKAPPSVWGLSRQSAGLCARFVTDAKSLRIRWQLLSDKLSMPHMPATGVSGLDLYVRVGARWQWLAVGRPVAKDTMQTFPALGAKAEYLLYLPLYNGVSSVEIGVPTQSSFVKAEARSPDKQKPIVFYGTSITQGGCASRPGMVHTAILGRRLDVPIVNLGFSGSGKMEQAVADVLAEIDASLFVIDCLPNMSADLIAERTIPLVKTLRKAHPQTPILLVEDRTYANASVIESVRARNDTSRAALKKAYAAILKEGIKGVSYLEGEHLIGDDGEGTVDNSHPSDLGFMRQADAFQKAIEPLLKRAPK